MAIKSILKLGNPKLRERCLPVEDFEACAEVFRDLNDTLTYVRDLIKSMNGTGLAAPQIGYQLRAIAIHFDNKRNLLVNPEIVEASSEMMSLTEGGLSFFDFRGQVERHKFLTVKAFNELAEAVEIQAKGQFSKLLQHEIDHLDGILYFDRLPNGEDSLLPVQGMPEIP
jgi:peptide deformylase